MQPQVAVHALGVALSCAAFGEVAAYPGYASCSTWQAGDFGHMGVSSLEDGSGGGCVINADISSSGFIPNAAYAIHVTSNLGPALFKLYSSDGQCVGDEIDAFSMSSSKEFTWVAPSAGSDITFYALCSTGYTSLQAAAAVSIGISQDLPVPAPTLAPSPPRSTTTVTPTPLSTSAPEAPSPPPGFVSVAQQSNVKLGESGMSLAFRPFAEDSIELEVTLDGLSWIGIGLSDGAAVSMTGNGGGSDIVTCSSAGAKRHFVQGYFLDAGVDVPEATCTQESGRTVLKFNRTLAAKGRRLQEEVSISPGSVQQLIYARGDDGVFDLQRHRAGSARGGQSIDFASGETVTLGKRSAEVILWIHLAVMSVAWGSLLPLGVVIAKLFRDSASWFRLHQGLQMLGWFLQLCGFAAAVWYVEEFSSHFSGLHAYVGFAVVTIGTLQPLNGLLRPHKPGFGEVKSKLRIAWECTHKSLGWLAISLGVVNMVIGCMLLMKKDYDFATVCISGAVAVLCVTFPLAAVMYSLPRKQQSSYPPTISVTV